MAQRLGIIIFGATGYTGRIVVEKIVSLAQKKNLSWGVAGRSKAKLQKVLDEVSKEQGAALNNVNVVVANVDEPESMRSMAKMCKVLINCVGPYRHWGEQTVRACVESGTHHVDVSGEPEYMERMQLLYHEQAEKNGVYVVSACGFDSVPAEIGCLHFIDQFNGDVNSMESYLNLSSKGNHKGASINYATWECIVYGMAHAKDLAPLRKKLYPHRLPAMTPKLRPRGKVFKNPVGTGWCMPFVGADQPVMRRSQYFFHEKKGKRPLQLQCYFTISSFANVMSFVIAGIFLSIFTKFNWGRQLLLKHPEFFTRGFISRDGPTEESRKDTEFSMTFAGEGWSEKTPDGIQNELPPDTRVVTQISGTDPAYGFAALCVLLCATTILEESGKMPGSGGVYPPGAAFHKTSLLSELQANGLKVKVVENKSILKNKL